ncbi:hypothetical protein [Methylobacterium sp. Leaf93]|uniref:hypothetical protein n=1 Tax=Methylobacterium sp. Leaf93 TaxID=1736249 RepID=UPI0006FC767C|nr:hypothetical protein [Methylobacterium sp. Leaf93]KQP15360.1 hypothetical protein ASF26_16615 [Methylobacterium sp. Leaf93]
MSRGTRHPAGRLLWTALAVSYLAGTAARAEPGEDAARDPALNPLHSIAPQSLTAFRDRPLFEASRRRYVAPRPTPVAEPVARAPAAPVPPPPNLRLLGLLQLGHEDLAIVRDLADRKIHRLRTGDVIQAWTVTIVSRAAIELALDKDRQELRMFSHRVGQDKSDADETEDDAPREEPSPVKVPELTLEEFKKRRQQTPTAE